MNLFQEFLSFGNWKNCLASLSTPSKHPSYKSLLNPIQGVNRNFLAPLSPPLERSNSTQGFSVSSAEGLAEVSGQRQSQAFQAGERKRIHFTS
jgi:hypothetical protein